MTAKTESRETVELDVLVKRAVEQIDKGAITLKDLLKTLAPEPAREEVPAEIPVPAGITEAQRDAVQKVGEVFGKVVPTEPRKLQPVEVAQLVEEREVLDELKAMAEERWTKGIRPTVHNHLDLVAEEEGVPEGAFKNSEGHWLLGGKVRGEADTSRQFSREIRNNAPTLDVSVLRALEDDPEMDFSHEDYLSMTTQTRVLDENKLMLALKKNPNLILAISKATRPGSKTASLYLRKA